MLDAANDRTIHSSVAEILRVLISAERQGQNLYSPLKQIEGLVNDLNDENLLNLYQRVVKSFQAATNEEQILADEYFTFMLRLCSFFNETRTSGGQVAPSNKATTPLIPA